VKVKLGNKTTIGKKNLKTMPMVANVNPYSNESECRSQRLRLIPVENNFAGLAGSRQLKSLFELSVMKLMRDDW
jgi:hypothetical protein